MKINIIYNKQIPNYKNFRESIECVLNEKQIDFKSFELNNMEIYGDFSFVIGGDGSLLKAARYYAEYKTPVMGINVGRLGFLSQIGINEFDLVIEEVLNERFYIEERLMLTSEKYTALNDFVIKGCSHSRTSRLYLEINNKPVCDYIADGLIISTPTGSTAYCLSAGGTVLHPNLNAVIIVPICPHTLYARPLVVPSTENITIKTGDKPLAISVDGFEQNEYINEISINSSVYKAQLAFIKKDSFYCVLRNKLHWGISPEN